MPYKEGIGISNADGSVSGPSNLPTTRHPDKPGSSATSRLQWKAPRRMPAPQGGFRPTYVHTSSGILLRPAMAVYLEIAQTARNIRPPMRPYRLLEELDLVMIDVGGKNPPPAALQRAQSAFSALDDAGVRRSINNSRLTPWTSCGIYRERQVLDAVPGCRALHLRRSADGPHTD